jgi:hypothetical protein
MEYTTEFWPGNPISYTTTIIKLFFDNQYLSNATGFVMQYGSEYALVTNWHVLSGRHAITGKTLSTTGGLPNRIEFHVTMTTIDTDKGKRRETRHFRACSINLFDSEKPIWIDDKEDNNHNDYCIRG